MFRIIKKILLAYLFKHDIPGIINNFYIYSNILGIINYLRVGKRKIYFQNFSLLLYFYSCSCFTNFVILFFFTKKNTERGEKIPFPPLNLRSLPISPGFRAKLEYFVRIPRYRLSRNSRTDTSPPLLRCSCVSRNKGKKRERKRGGGKMEERRRKIALHATFWQIYITYL